MADEASNSPNPFHLRTIQNLVRLMSEHDLAEVDLRQGDTRIRLRRGGSATEPAVVPVVAAPPSVAPAPASVPPAVEERSEPAKPARAELTIKSPVVGTFYTASNPDAPPFVTVGSRVTPTTVVCVIEAMKIFNEIQAECTGVITEILVQNQQPVEYGQELFKVDPTG